MTCLWAFVIWFLLPDSPSNARFLSHRDRLIAVKRVSGNETGIKNKSFNRSQIAKGFTDPKTILIFISVFAAWASLTNELFSSYWLWLKALYPTESLTHFRQSLFVIWDLAQQEPLNSNPSVMRCRSLLYLSAEPSFSTCQTVSHENFWSSQMIVDEWLARLLTATAANIICTIAAACMAFLPSSYTWGRLASFWLVNSQSVGFTVSLTTISSNMAGYTHRSLASAMVLWVPSSSSFPQRHLITKW